MEDAKLIIEVVAGLIPEKPDPDLTKRFFITSKEWHETSGDRGPLLADCVGKAQGYAFLLMLQPGRLNWVRTDWIWV